MERRNFFKSIWEYAVKGVFVVLAGSWIWESRPNPFRERYEQVQFAKKRDDEGCTPGPYKPKCGESEGEIYSSSCKKNYKPNQPCTDGFSGKCIPASAVSKKRR